MYELTETKTVKGKPVRVYRNVQTNTEVRTTPIYTDTQGKVWWGFVDLYKVPYLRIAFAKHISDMFTMGLGLADILQWCKEEKEILRGDDPEKYEKLYAKILEKETLAKHIADPIKQHLALCTIYVLHENEKIDTFSDEQANEKLLLWKADLDATAFFLTWHNEHINGYMNNLAKISKTVSAIQKMSS